MARKKVAPPPPPPPAVPAGAKIDQLIALLSRPHGATIAQMVELTGWQVHTVRGCMAGTLKKKRKLAVTSQKVEGVRTYRIGP